jgi:hypothetical protein
MKCSDAAFHRSRWRTDPRSNAMRVCMLAATLMGLSLAGCGKQERPLFPAEGQVFLNKEPVAGALVVLYPQGPLAREAAPARAQTGPDGRFRVGTRGADDGAPEGEYAVTVVSYPVRPGDGGAGRNVLPKKYASPQTTDLRVTIRKDATALPSLVLSDDQRRANGQKQAGAYH